MKLMLLAAGLGTRLRPVTNRFAKPAVPFLNVPLLFWAVEFLNELKLETVVVNLHHLPHTIKNLEKQILKSAKNDSPPLRLHFSHEPEAPLGSGGGLWKAKKHFESEGSIGSSSVGSGKNQSFLIANADEVIFPMSQGTLHRLQREHEDHDNIATLLTMRRSDVGTKFGGVWVSENRVLGFGKDRSAFPDATDGLHYVGVMILSPRIFKYLPEGESNILYDAVATAIAKGERVSAVTEDLVWFETGSPKDYLEATSEVLKLISPKEPTKENLLASLQAKAVLRRHLNDGSVFWESHEGSRALIADMGKGSVPRSQIYEHLSSDSSSFAVIGSGALVESARIRNSVVLSTAQIQRDVELKNEIKV